MTTLTREQIFPYDVKLSGQMERLGAARGRAERAPLDYSRLGGMALAKRGDMLGAFYDAATRARGERDLQEQQRRSQWAEAGARKEAATLGAQARAASGFVGGLGKIAMGAASEAAAGTGEKAEKFRDFLTKAYSGRWDPKTNTWAGWSPRKGSEKVEGPPITVGSEDPWGTKTVAAEPPPQAEASAPVSTGVATSDAVTFPGDPYEYVKVGNQWTTRLKGSSDDAWREFTFTGSALQKLEAAIGGGV